MAKKEEPQSLFRRLTRLFRSGPVIKKKIKSFDTTMAVADKTKSSGTLLFQKSLAPTYATITANAYNLSERLMRYQDFQEMEYSLAIDTKIATPDGFKTIGELAKECEKDVNKTFIVYAYDHNLKKIVPAFGKQARQTCVDHAWKVTFDNGQTITASPEHRLMLRDGSYRKVEDLQHGDSMMPFYRKDLFADAEEGTKGYSWIYTMDERSRGWTKEHQLIAEWVAGRKLTEDECVHHINFVKSDNRPENLRIMSNFDHTSINNTIKLGSTNNEWIDEFKKNHAIWMRDNAPTERHDVTFARILETAERVGFNLPAIASTLDVTWNLVLTRLVANGFANFAQFIKAYSDGQQATLIAKTPGLLTRDLSINLIKQNITENDTKRSLCIKLGCTVNVLDKFFDRRIKTSWKQLRIDLGFSEECFVETNVKLSRPNCNDLTFQQVCNVYNRDLSLPRLSEKLGVNKNTVISRLAQNGFKKYSDFKSMYDNHKVVSVEYVGEIPLYDLTVDGYKNFATDSIISHNTPEIAAALDIYADETCAQDEKGRILHIYSDNEKIKEILEDLFYNTLNTEFNLRSWARNLVKYGDFFLYNDVSPTYGVVSAFPVPVNEIEREENYDRDDPFAIRYRWVTLGNRVLENWEITHFRLLGNDMFLPYGSSIIEPARRIWRQLILIEDAMLVYRVVRAPERRVFYIDVANIPAEDVPLYVEEQRKNLRTNQVVDKTSGRVDIRYNPLPVHKDTPVPLLDGSTLTIEILSNKMKENTNWVPFVYSVQDTTQKVVPGKVVWCDKNYTATKLIKVWLDNESYITTAPEHPFVLRDGSSKRADELLSGDNLMSAHCGTTTKSYEKIVETYEIDYTTPANHQVLKIEIINDANDDVYCMTVVGNNGEDDRHNFAVNCIGDIEKDTKSLIFVRNSVDEDYFIPVRGTESGTKIDTLAGGQNTAAVEDVAYIQKKLFAALKIPRAYLGYDEMLSSKATLAQEDIRFSRTIAVIQKTMLAELNKLAIIHLYAHGFSDDDLQNFTLHLSNPSTIAQQQKLELWRAKFEIGGSAPEGYINKDFVRKEIWGLNDEECKQIDKNRLKDKMVDAAIEASQSEDDGSADTGLGGGDSTSDDLFSGSSSEPSSDTEAPKSGGTDDELPPEENAGEEPEEEKSDVELLMSSDNVDDDETFGLRVSALKNFEVPVKAQRQLDRVLYNRSRVRTHGASKTHMPDFKKMTSNDNHAMEDPYDNDWMKSIVSNPFGEARKLPVRTSIPADLAATLSRWSEKHGLTTNNNSLLKESADDNHEIDDEEELNKNDDVFIIDDDEDDDDDKS